MELESKGPNLYKLSVMRDDKIHYYVKEHRIVSVLRNLAKIPHCDTFWNVSSYSNTDWIPYETNVRPCNIGIFVNFKKFIHDKYGIPKDTSDDLFNKRLLDALNTMLGDIEIYYLFISDLTSQSFTFIEWLLIMISTENKIYPWNTMKVNGNLGSLNDMTAYDVESDECYDTDSPTTVNNHINFIEIFFTNPEVSLIINKDDDIYKLFRDFSPEAKYLFFRKLEDQYYQSDKEWKNLKFSCVRVLKKYLFLVKPRSSPLVIIFSCGDNFKTKIPDIHEDYFREMEIFISDVNRSRENIVFVS